MREKKQSYNKKKSLAHAGIYIFLIIFAFFYSLPTLAMVGTALKGNKNALSDLSLIPSQFDFSAFREVFKTDFMKTAMNSLFVSVCVSLLCVGMAIAGGYALSRNKGRLFSFYNVFLLVLQMFPLMLRLLPLFLIFKKIGLLNTHYSLIITYTGLNLPFSILLLKGFFDTIPVEIEESAMIDGCNKTQTLIKIVLPVSLAGVATVAIFTFLNVWNEFTFANVFISNPDLSMLTVGLQRYVTQNEISWAQMMAASTIGIMPSMVFLFFAQKYIVRGMTSGAVKG